ncbi:MAG TPA: hypothetical protein VM580_04080 [Labilithrix sp.]|nr:hypothetical protein [Labilithrix sp.]
MSAAKAKKESKKNWQLAGSSWENAWKVFAGVGGVGLVAAGFGYTQDARRFAFSWLFAFITVLTIALGALFFVLIQHLTSAGWSVTVRRTAEFFGLGIIALVPLFLPVVGTMNHLFPWLNHGEAPAAHPEPPAHVGSLNLITPAYAQDHAPAPAAAAAAAADAAAAAAPAEAHEGATHGVPAPSDAADPAGRLPGAHGGPPSDAPVGGAHGAAAAHGAHAAHGPAGDPHEVIEKNVLAKKAPYLNRNFFLARVVVYFVVWVLLAVRLFGNSTTQDKSKDPKLTLASQRLAPPAIFLYGLTLTFAAFDWIMSLDPMWFSTIFGVVIFATGVVSSLATLILVTLALRSAGPLEGAVTIEHYHDLGKLMFGFMVFWAYVSFSQYMLIWYAALPEETIFFHNRWNHAPWAGVSMAIILFHFVVPFFWTISRNFKRNVGRLQIGAALLLVMHVVDIYWFVMPNFLLGKEGFSFHWLDLACLLAVAGIYSAFVFHRMTQHSLVAVGDPRLERSLQFTNA